MITRKDRDTVEQAIARGWNTRRIMHEYGYSYGVVKQVRDAMEFQPADKAINRKPKTPVAVPCMPTHRTGASYYGPASPDVISALVDALFPPRTGTRQL